MASLINLAWAAQKRFWIKTVLKCLCNKHILLQTLLCAMGNFSGYFFQMLLNQEINTVISEVALTEYVTACAEVNKVNCVCDPAQILT